MASKFSAAKNNNATDTNLQKSLNYLIDLLNTGYVAEYIVNGHTIRISVDPKDGLMITYDGVQIGGLAIINDEITSISQTQTNDATDPTFWTKVGENVVDGVTYTGLLGFLKAFSTTVPAVWLTTKYFAPGNLLTSSIRLGGIELTSSCIGSGDNEYEIRPVNYLYPSLSGFNDGMNQSIYFGMSDSIGLYGSISGSSQIGLQLGSLYLGIDSGGTFATIGSTKTYFSSLAAGDHTHPDATTLVAGFESAEDKTKLDGLTQGISESLALAYAIVL
jgi:hypothetical protein